MVVVVADMRVLVIVVMIVLVVMIMLVVVVGEGDTFFFLIFILYTLLIPFGKFVFVTQRNCVATEQRHW